MMNAHKLGLRVLVCVRDPSWCAWFLDQVRTRELGWQVTVCDAHALEAGKVPTEPVDVAIVDGRAGVEAGSILVALRAAHPMLACVSVHQRPLLPPGPAPSFATVAVLPALGASAELESVIERAFTLSRILDQDLVRNTIARFTAAPELAPTYRALSMAVARADTAAFALSEIVERDAEMTFKVLQVANSAFFGFGRRISSMCQAMHYLGLDVVHALLVSAHVIAALAEAEPRRLSLDRFFRYSVRIARLNKQFVGDPALDGQAFATGILHDMGKLVLAVTHRSLFEEVVERVATSGDSHAEAERELFGATHTELGAALLGSWGFPFGIVEAVAFHHSPAHVASGDVRLLAAIHAADALSGVVFCGEPLARLDTAFLARAGMLDELPRFRALVEDQRAQLAARH